MPVPHRWPAAVADVGVGDYPEMVSHGINAVNKTIMTAVLFSACSAYDRALHTGARLCPGCCGASRVWGRPAAGLLSSLSLSLSL